MRPNNHKRRGTGARILALASVALVAAVALAACSSSATMAPVNDEARPAAAAPEAPTGAGADSGRSAAGVTNNGTGQPAASPGNQQQVLDGRLIIRTGSMAIEVPGLDDALAKVEGIVTAAGGYLAGGQRAGTDENASATMTYRIPVGQFDATLRALHGVGTKLLSEQVSSDEVTSQVVDLDARITNLRSTEAALQKIMEAATRISDVLEVQSQLSAVREQIEVLVAQKGGLVGRASMSTLTVTFSLPPVVAVQTVSKGWDPASAVDRSLATLVEFGQGLVEFLIWFGIVAVPFLVLVGIPLLVVVLVARRRNRRRPAGPAAPSGPASPEPTAA